MKTRRFIVMEFVYGERETPTYVNKVRVAARKAIIVRDIDI